MARYLGLVSSDLRGKIGGVVGTRATSGTTLRTKVAGVQPRSVRQHDARQLLGYLSAAWRTQEVSTQAAWASLASQSTLTNSLGVQYTPSAQQLFLALQATYYKSSGVLLSMPPTTVPNVPVASSITFTLDSGVLHLQIFSSYTGPTPLFKVYVSPPLSAGVSYRHRSATKFLTFYLPPSGQVDVTSQWLALYGVLPTGVNVKLYALPTDGPSGYPGTPSSGIFYL